MSRDAGSIPAASIRLAVRRVECPERATRVEGLSADYSNVTILIVIRLT